MEMMETALLVKGFNVRHPDTELVDSIRKHGIKTPIMIYNGGGFWEVKDGHRRLAAALALGIIAVPVVEVDTPSSMPDGLVDQVIINQDRKPMSYLEMAKVFQTLVENGWSQNDVAERFDFNKSIVSLALAALSAHPKVQQAIEEGKISPSAIEPLLSQDNDTQVRLIEAAVREKTVRKVRALIQADKKMTSILNNNGVRYNADLEDDEDDTDYDPNDMVTVTALDEALAYLSTLKVAPIKDRDLHARGRLNVSKLLDIATRLDQVIN